MVEVTITFVINPCDYPDLPKNYAAKDIKDLVENQILEDFRNWKNARNELFPNPEVKVRELMD